MVISVMAFCGDFLLYASHDYWIYLYEQAIKKIQIITRWKTANDGINKCKWLLGNFFVKHVVKLFTLWWWWFKL